MSDRHHLEIRSKEHPLQRAVYLDGEELTFVSRVELVFDANGESSAVITVPGELVDIDLDASAFITAHATVSQPTAGVCDTAEARERLGESGDLPVVMPLPGSLVHVVKDSDTQHAVYYVLGYFGSTGLALSTVQGLFNVAAEYMAVEYDPTAMKRHSWHYAHDDEHSEPEPEAPGPITVNVHVEGTVVDEKRLRDLVERLILLRRPLH